MLKDKGNYFFAFFSFVITFVVYFFTANRSIAFTDCGELACACSTLGIAHPTGYPLFVILAYLWSKISLVDNKIFWLNLFSSFLVAVSVLIFFFAVYELIKIVERKQGSKTQSKQVNALSEFGIISTAFISAMTYGFGSTIWLMSTSLEVYPLQLVLFNLIFLLLFKTIANDYDIKFLFLLAFFVGLSFTNHLTTLLILPTILLSYFWRQDRSLYFDRNSLKLFLLLLIPFLIGLSLYLYLPIRSSVFPEFNWGWVSRSFEKFFYHVTGRQYRVWMFSSSDIIGVNFQKFLGILPINFAWVGLVFVLWGVFYLLKKNNYFVILLLTSLFSCLIYSLNYSIHDIETYFSLALVVLFFFFAIGVYAFWRGWNKFGLILIIIPIISLVTNYKRNDESNNNLVVTYTRNIIENLDSNSIVISAQWDFFCSAFWYLQRVEGYRKDVVLIEKELLRRTWYLEQLKRWYPDVIGKSSKEIEDFLSQLELFESGEPYDANLIQFYFVRLLRSFVEKNIKERSVYLTFDVLQNQYDAVAFQNFEIIPTGFALKILPNKVVEKVHLDKIQIDPFVKFKNRQDDHLVKGIIDATILNLTALYQYSNAVGDSSSAEKIYNMIERLR